MNRRKVLQGLAAGTAGSIGLAFGSGAFTSVEADREFEIDLADSDAESQLVIEANDDLPSSATTTGDDDEFEIDGSRITPGARTTFGCFDDITDEESLDEGVFIIRNENETEEDIDIEVEIDLNESNDSEIELALLHDGDVATDSGDEDDPAKVDVDGVPSAVDDDTDDPDAEVEVGFIVDAGSDDDDLEGDLTIDAELSEEG